MVRTQFEPSVASDCALALKACNTPSAIAILLRRYDQMVSVRSSFDHPCTLPLWPVHTCFGRTYIMTCLYIFCPNTCLKHILLSYSHAIYKNRKLKKYYITCGFQCVEWNPLANRKDLNCSLQIAFLTNEQHANFLNVIGSKC